MSCPPDRHIFLPAEPSIIEGGGARRCILSLSDYVSLGLEARCNQADRAWARKVLQCDQHVKVLLGRNVNFGLVPIRTSYTDTE